MTKLFELAQYILGNFGPLLIFYAAQHFYSLKAAIAISLAFTVGEIALKLIKRKPFGNFFIFSVVATLVFGSLDLYLKNSVFFKYEAALTNVIFGFYFASTFYLKKSMIQEFYEQRKSVAQSTAPDLPYFFKILTLIWVFYFFAKGGFYFWLAENRSIEQALLIRSTFGTASLYGLIFIMTAGGKKLYFLFKKLGILPETRNLDH